MNFFILLQGVGSIGLFASRAFVTAFVTALLMRYGPELPYVAGADLFENVRGAPTWFTNDTTLLVLGIFAVLEVLSAKNAELRAALEQMDQYVKPTIAGLTYMGVVSSADAEFVEKVVQPAGFFEYPALAVIVPGVWFMAQSRAAVLGILAEADEDDDLGIQKLISWAEDVGVAGGLFLLVLFPVVMVVLIGIASGMLVLMRRRAEAREQSTKIPCAGCGEQIYPCAVACPSCGVKVKEPCAVGFLGQSVPGSAADLARQPYRLVEKKRCPVCAERLTERAAPQNCPVCGHKVLADAQFAEAYFGYVAGRVPGVLAVCAALSAIPVVGLIPGVIFYRLQLVAPFRRYIPFGRRLLLKGVIWLVLFVLIAFQWVPVAGAVVVPLMAIVNYSAYRRSIGGQLADSAPAEGV